MLRFADSSIKDSIRLQVEHYCNKLMAHRLHIIYMAFDVFTKKIRQHHKAKVALQKRYIRFHEKKDTYDFTRKKIRISL